MYFCFVCLFCNRKPIGISGHLNLSIIRSLSLIALFRVAWLIFPATLVIVNVGVSYRVVPTDESFNRRVWIGQDNILLLCREGNQGTQTITIYIRYKRTYSSCLIFLSLRLRLYSGINGLHFTQYFPQFGLITLYRCFAGNVLADQELLPKCRFELFLKVWAITYFCQYQAAEKTLVTSTRCAGTPQYLLIVKVYIRTPCHFSPLQNDSQSYLPNVVDLLFDAFVVTLAGQHYALIYRQGSLVFS